MGRFGRTGELDMELMQLEMFVAVVEERSFLRAAERVFRTQPAVSIGLRKLEERIGVPLLDRSHRRGGGVAPSRGSPYQSARPLFFLVGQGVFAFLNRR